MHWRKSWRQLNGEDEQMEDLKLVHYSEEHREALLDFYLPKGQEKFTALPHQLMDTVKEGQYRIVILHNEEPVGFFLLHATQRVKDYTDQAQAMLLTALSVDEKQQGKGYAKQAMLLLKEFVKKEFPGCREIVLAVNHRNTVAQALYQKVGFHDTDRRKIGPIGEQWIMALELGE